MAQADGHEGGWSELCDSSEEEVGAEEGPPVEPEAAASEASASEVATSDADRLAVLAHRWWSQRWHRLRARRRGGEISQSCDLAYAVS